MTIVHRNAEPFFWEGKKELACLLVHGFTGSPSELRLLGQHLKDQGYAVSGILLPGHGTTPQELAKVTWIDWYGAVEEEYLKLKQNYAKVIPIGLSMGGILSFHLAAKQQVPGVVSLSAPIHIGNRKAYLAPLLKLFYSYHQKPVAKEKYEEELKRGHFSYNITPVKALASLIQLIGVVKKELPQITVPTLLMQSQDDRTVNPQSAQYLYDNLGSNTKELIWLEKSGHVITLGQERQLVFGHISRFLENVNREP